MAIGGLTAGRADRGWVQDDPNFWFIDQIHREVGHVPAINSGVDLPLWVGSNPVRLVMKFISHVFGADQGILLCGLSGWPKHLAEFVTTGASMGMPGAYLNHIAEGDFEGAERFMEQPEDWIVRRLVEAVFYGCS